MSFYDSPEIDVANFARTVEASATAAITQYFFSNDAYCRFLDWVGRLGLEIPIVPGSMPLTDSPRSSSPRAKPKNCCRAARPVCTSIRSTARNPRCAPGAASGSPRPRCTRSLNPPRIGVGHVAASRRALASRLGGLRSN
jgi:hypothetical protein